MSHELDILIAEKVFGYEVRGSIGSHELRGGEGTDMVVVGPFAIIPEYGPVFLKDYSTNIATAWEVAQKICDIDEDHEFEIHLSSTKFKECTVMVRYWDYSDKEPVLSGPYYITAETAPLAICLAALKVVKK